MNTNREYYNYAIRHLETLNSVINQMERINDNLYSMYRRPLPTSTGSSRRNTTTNRQPSTSRFSNTYPTTNTTNTANTNNTLSNLATNVLTSLFLDPVPIYPTEQEIETATSVVAFADLPNEQTTCPITMVPFDENTEILRIDHCGHVFSKPAIMRWFRNHVSCPVCRHDVRESSIGATTQTGLGASPTGARTGAGATGLGVSPNTQTYQFDLNLDTNEIYNAFANNTGTNYSTEFYTFPLPPTYRRENRGNNNNNDNNV